MAKVSANKKEKVADADSPLARAFSILEAIARADGPISASAIADEVGLPAPSVHRIAVQLERQRLLNRALDSKAFVVALRLSALSMALLRSSAYSGPLHAILQKLATEVREICNVGIQVRDEVMYIDNIPSAWPLTVHFGVGSRVPLHCTSIGKLFLAQMDTQQRAKLFQAGLLQRFTQRTVTEPHALERILQGVARNGYAITDQEYIDAVVGVAVPITGSNGRVYAGLSVSAPKSRVSLRDLKGMLPALRNAAQRISAAYLKQSTDEKKSAVGMKTHVARTAR